MWVYIILGAVATWGVLVVLICGFLGACRN